jgi:hypothetical protein
MNRIRLLPVLALSAAAAALPLTAQAQDQTDPYASAKVLGSVKVDKKAKTATLRVRYQCSHGDALWVSLKQSARAKKAKALTKEGSSKVAAAWWQSHRDKFTCDGKSHTDKFTIDKVEPGSKGTLKAGKAWLQFCVTVPGQSEQDEGELVLSASGWVTVAGGAKKKS